MLTRVLVPLVPSNLPKAISRYKYDHATLSRSSALTYQSVHGSFIRTLRWVWIASNAVRNMVRSSTRPNDDHVYDLVCQQHKKS